MFAKWIPDALARIEELGQLPEPPDSLAITRARREVVNFSDHYPDPKIEVWDTEGKRGIWIDLGLATVGVGPDGSVVHGR